MSIKLFEHNEKAYRAAVLMLEQQGRAAVIHPTGTGKSFIAFRLCADNPEKNILWLSPSEYIFKTQLENVRKASPDFNCGNITFVTYSKLMIMSAKEIEEISPSYIIFDEFHRCGAAEWGKGVECLLTAYPDVPILGLSATAIRYLDNQRNMADELFDGNIASEMTLGEAIVRGILTPPTYIVSMYSYQKELDRYERRIKKKKYKAVQAKAEKYLEALRRALEKADGIPDIFRKHMKNKSGKYIVFCANVEHMEEMIELSRGWFSEVDKKPHIYKAFSDNPQTSTAFAEFKSDNSGHLKLLYCIDMLNEGIHVDDVSGVILLRPTISPIIYKQQIGRALSASKATEPIIFDIVNNFENLYSISAIQEEMQTAMTYYRSHGQEKDIVNEHFKIIDVLRDCNEIFCELEDTLTVSWDVMYSYAKAYYEEHGDLEVPRRYKTPDGYSLGNWLSTQRKVYNGTQYGELDSGRIEKLNKIGMRWKSAGDVSWERFYSEAKAYYDKNGDLDTNINYVSETGYPLGKKMCRMRSYRKSNIKLTFLTSERIAMLDELGMIWSVPDYLWEQNYMAAMEYYREHESLDVPYDYTASNGVNLGIWVRTLRRLRQTDSPLFNLSHEQIRQLDEIGMLWDGKYERQWNNGYREAEKYFKRHGNLDVANSYVTADGYKLGAWISNQRENAEKIKLDAIGMIWKKPDSWEARYQLAKEYYEEHGDLNVPPKYTADGVWLNKWLNEQKQIYYGRREGKTLTSEQIKRLEAIGMDWKSSAERAWEIRYEAVSDFYEEHGHLDIPKDYILSDGRKIGDWIIKQRKYYREGKLSTKQVSMLNDVGMSWDRKAS